MTTSFVSVATGAFSQAALLAWKPMAYVGFSSIALACTSSAPHGAWARPKMAAPNNAKNNTHVRMRQNSFGKGRPGDWQPKVSHNRTVANNCQMARFQETATELWVATNAQADA